MNEGYYALLGAILGLSVETSLRRICGFSHGEQPNKIQSYKRVLIDTAEMRKAMNRKGYGYREMSALAGCSTSVVYRALKGCPIKMLWVEQFEKILEISLIKGEQ